jgi:hypothetical protein
MPRYHIGAGANDTGPGSDYAHNCTGGCTAGGTHHWEPGTTFYGPTSILHGPSVAGPWSTLDIGNGSALPGCPQCGDTNPAPVVAPDGTVRMMWRGSGRGFPTSEMLMATAPRWQGPYNFSTANLFPNSTAVHIEDAHMWVQELPAPAAGGVGGGGGRHHWHALFHSDVEKTCGGAAGGHAWSADGASWSFSPWNAFGNEVALANGSKVRSTGGGTASAASGSSLASPQ